MLKGRCISVLQSINDISASLNVSKMTIYRKLKVKELKSYIVIKQGIQYLDDDGLTLLKQMLKNKCEDDKDDVNDNLKNEEIAIDKDDYITLLKSEIDFFKSEIQEKNIQITNLNNRLGSEQDLHKNTQILLKNQQGKPNEDILLLENHFKELDVKIIEVINNMEQKKAEHERKNKTGILNWFKLSK